ncbi:hypothetical protein P8452_30798 [Trifolium repens]|nr:hypothetical protein P8452_30798 [Trifolium repens]
MSKRGFGGENWCVVGDFNAIRERGERRSSRSMELQSQSREINEFDSFLEGLELYDLPLLGRRFTWVHPNGVAMSRLDRVLLSEGWMLKWTNPKVWVLNRDVSDHCPLVVRYSSLDWGPKPFRFNNYWFHHKAFKKVVEEAWGEQTLSGWMGFVLKDRLKGLKAKIKEWNAEVFSNAEVKKKHLIEKILAIDLKSEDVGITSDEVASRRILFDDLWVLLKSIDASIVQRSRSRWMKEGDSNSRYFHVCINARQKSNNIIALRTPLGWREGPVEVRSAVVEFFKLHFDNVVWHRPVFEGVVFTRITEDDNLMLRKIFGGEEIEAVVKSIDGSKSPGPDGFNFMFVKEFWRLLKYDIRILFDQFHGNECIPQCLMSYFITLVPKVKSPQCLGDFRPISLLGCIYKLLAKVLAARLALVLDPIISKTQSAFLKGRQLVDGVVVVNEVIDSAKKNSKQCLILKVDFEKAYDSVDCGFLDHMLCNFGFCDKWRAWMRSCVCAGSMSVLVNGSPTMEINIKRGLKQGDPLAPLLFLLVAEGLGVLMRRAVELNRFQPFLLGREGMPVSMLQYADDTLCIGEASIENL